jgi:hypothetical protein
MTTEASKSRGHVPGLVEFCAARLEMLADLHNWGSATMRESARLLRELASTPPYTPVGVAGVIEWLRKSAAACGPTEYGEGCRDAMNETADKLAALTQQPEARGVVDVEAIRRACESGKRFWKSGPGYYEEIESLLPALTEARNG